MIRYSLRFVCCGCEVLVNAGSAQNFSVGVSVRGQEFKVGVGGVPVLHKRAPVDYAFPNPLIAPEILFLGVVPISLVVDNCPPDASLKVGGGAGKDEDRFY